MTSPLPSQSDPLNSPESMLLRALLGESTDSIIRSQEKQGQGEVVSMDILPKDGLLEHRAQWEALGVEIGNEVDDLFVNVKLPPGWKKQATDHDMWSHLVDDKGRKRASIFYKAAFYDRSAHMGSNRRYVARRWYANDPLREQEYDTSYSSHLALVLDMGTPGPCDGGSVVWQSEPFDNPRCADGDQDRQLQLYKQQDRVEGLAREWLKEHYPDHDDPFAYWDRE